MAKIIVEANPYETASIHKGLFSLIQIFGASIFIAICAQISLPLFFTPVPLTLQTFAILLVGGMLGPKKAIASVLLYLAEGCCGFPVFAERTFGLLALIGPRGGYLVGFALQAYLAGWILERPSSALSNRLLATLFLACVAQMAIGVAWLTHFVGRENVLLLGFYPFIPGEIFKCIAAAAFLTRWKRSRNVEHAELS